MIGICCDSGAQLPTALASAHGIEVAPLTVTVDGVDHLETALDPDAFWAHFADGHVPELTTAAPSPGQIAEHHRRLFERGATTIVSVHTGSAISGTFNAARLAAEGSPVPVELVDTGSASFVVGCAALAAAEAVAAGASASDAAATARSVATRPAVSSSTRQRWPCAPACSPGASPRPPTPTPPGPPPCSRRPHSSS